MTGTIIFNGTSSEDFGLIVEKLPPSVHASRRGDLISIPGRNGVIVREDGSFDTYQQEYQISFTQAAQNRDPYAAAREIAVWLLGASGFCRLEDGFEPEHFRLARYSGEYNVDTVLMEYGKATLTFDVQPQRYLKSGETSLTFTGGSTTSITNPTQFEARPLLKFTDTSTPPTPVVQTLTMVDDRRISASGDVVPVPSGYGMSVSQPVNCSGNLTALITGNGVVFLDSDGQTRANGFIPSGKVDNSGVNTTWSTAVPDWAVTIRVSSISGSQSPAPALTLRGRHVHPGASAVNINGIVVNLDFSGKDTIYLDCDLHDAYYEDGSNANQMVSFSSSIVAYPTFPGLSPGVNSIIPASSDISFEMTPRWWTL